MPHYHTRGLGVKADPAAAPLPRAGGRGVGRGQSREVYDGSRGTRAQGLLLHQRASEKPPSFPLPSPFLSCRGGETLFLMPPPSTPGNQHSPCRRYPSPGLQKVCRRDTATLWSFSRTVSAQRDRVCAHKHTKHTPAHSSYKQLALKRIPLDIFLEKMLKEESRMPLRHTRNSLGLCDFLICSHSYNS